MVKRSHTHLTNGIYLYISETKKEVTLHVKLVLFSLLFLSSFCYFPFLYFNLELLKAENLSSPPLPVILEVELNGMENVEFTHRRNKFKKWLLPQNQPKTINTINPANPLTKLADLTNKSSSKGDEKERVQVLTAKGGNKSLVWKFECKVSFKVASKVEDFVEFELGEREEELLWFEEKVGKLVTPLLQKIQGTQREENVEANVGENLEENVGEVEKLVEEVRRVCESSNLEFVDAQFPPCKKSLYIDLEDLPKKMIPFHFKRPSHFFPQNLLPSIFPSNGVQPEDILQGKLGDCWFLATIALCATQPQLIQKLFITKKYSPQGLYALQFYREGEWKKVLVDDYFPCTPSSGFIPFDFNEEMLVQLIHERMTFNPNLPLPPPNSIQLNEKGLLYSRSRDDALWVCLLEKGYAKLNQSYQALCAGTLSESFRDLTGFPSLVYYFPFMQEEEKKEKVWRVMREAFERKELIGASSRIETPLEKQEAFKLEQVGIVSRHAYSVLALHQIDEGESVKEEGGSVKLVELRNPWGDTLKWKGEYSPSSPLWTSELRRRVGNEKEREGVFFIPFHHFLLYFNEITICKNNSLLHSNYFSCQGEYTQTSLYGPQLLLHNSSPSPSPLLITLSKKGLFSPFSISLSFPYPFFPSLSFPYPFFPLLILSTFFPSHSFPSLS